MVANFPYYGRGATLQSALSHTNDHGGASKALVVSFPGSGQDSTVAFAEQCKSTASLVSSYEQETQSIQWGLGHITQGYAGTARKSIARLTPCAN